MEVYRGGSLQNVDEREFLELEKWISAKLPDFSDDMKGVTVERFT